VDRRILWLSVLVCSTVGGLAPEAWGGSAFGLASLVLSAAGAVVGVVLAARLSA
jgi:hypothetical protein